MAVQQALLMRQERRTLHEEDRERRHADIGLWHRSGSSRDVCPGALAALAQAARQGREPVHMANESRGSPVSEASFGGGPRVLGHLWRLRLTSDMVLPGRSDPMLPQTGDPR
jgi:hypothetical protein